MKFLLWDISRRTFRVYLKYSERVYWGKIFAECCGFFVFCCGGGGGVRRHGERREFGSWEDFERNTVPQISAAAPVPVRGAEVFSVKNTLGILVTERRL